VAIRALILPTGKELKGKKAPPPGGGWPETVLVLDTETSTDPSQRLLFGGYRFGVWRPDGTLECLEEGLFYDDDLPTLRPEEFGVLCAYVEAHRRQSAGEGELRLLTRRAFVTDRLWKAVEQGSLIVGFNLPFDLSRLAVYTGKPRGNMFAGGFTQPLFEWLGRDGRYRLHGYRPWFRFKCIDRNRAVMGWAGIRSTTGPRIRRPDGFGPLLDLKALAFALTGQGYSLNSAAKQFGLPVTKHVVEAHGTISADYVAYARQDVAVTWQLLEALRAEWDRHPVAVSPHRALSPAALAKGYLRAMGITPPLAKTPGVTPAHLAPWMNAYYGGRAEVRVRRVPVPVVYVDFLSMYPTVNVLLGLWRLVTAATLHIRDATTRVRELVTSVTLERCFDPSFWPALCFVARIRPDGEVLPIRTYYDEAAAVPTIGVNMVRSPDQSVWVPGPDLVADILLSGHVPEVLEARELVGEGQQEGLRPTSLRGQVPLNPETDDFFRTLIERRSQVKRGRTDVSGIEADRLQGALKVVANVVAYGLAAQLDRPVVPGSPPAPVTVYGVDGAFASTAPAPEEPGEYFFPPFATLITAGARLMLAMLERQVADAGGHIAFGDTDSAAVIATEHGGTVPCPGGEVEGPDGRPAIRTLTWEQVRGFVQAFVSLNPYDRRAVPGSILKIESVDFSDDGEQRALYAYAISAKRYALFVRSANGDPQVVVAKEHGLGHLMNPCPPGPGQGDEATDEATDEGDDERTDEWTDEGGIQEDEAGDETADEVDAGRPWVRQLVWLPLIREALGLPTALPDAVDLPAVTRLGVTRSAFLDTFGALNHGKPYPEQIKPTNFALSTHVAPFGHPPGVDPHRFHLFAPFERDPLKWQTQPWYDLHSQQPYVIGVGPGLDPDVVRVQSYRDIIEAYATHPEAKSIGPDGQTCHRRTVGVLRRQSVDIAEVTYVGKESNQLEETRDGVIHEVTDVLTPHQPFRATRWWRLLVPALRETSMDRLVKVSGCTPRYVRMLLAGTRRPSTQVGHKLWQEGKRWARRTLKRRNSPSHLQRVARRLAESHAPMALSDRSNERPRRSQSSDKSTARA
jgi:hypothetical protein